MAEKKRSYLQRVGIVPVTGDQLKQENNLAAQQAQAARMAEQQNAQVAAQSKAPTTTQPNGKYDATKGGYVTETGQLYPTKEPNFVPGATGKPGTSIEFTKDNNVVVDGKTMTRQEYDRQRNNKSYYADVAQAQQAQQIQQAVSQIGLSPQEIAQAQAQATEAPIDLGQAATAGGAKVIPSAITGAGVGLGAAIGGGAIAGTAVAPGVGTAIGAGVGLLAGVTAGILANIKSQQSGEIASTKDVLTTAKSDMRKLSSLAAKDPGNAAAYVEMYNQRLAQVYTAQAKLKLETNGNLNKFMNDGTQDLSDFELFLQPNGQAAIYKRQLELALMSGVAPELTAEDLTA